MKKRICMILLASMMSCLLLCACGTKEEMSAANDAFASAKDEMLEDESEGTENIVEQEEIPVINDITVQNDDTEQNVGQMMDETPNNDVMNFADYDGLVYSRDYDSSYLSLLDAGDKLTVYLVLDEDINGNSGFFDGEVVLTADQCLTGDGNYSFRGIPSVDNSIKVDFDFCPDGSVMVAANKDDGGYASCELICAEFAQRANAAHDNSGNQAQLDNSALASFVGEYKNSNGDSFIIEQDKGTGKYKIYMVKLYSAEGWPEDVDVDGVRFYDTPTIESITGDVNDMIIVETLSQYSAGSGTFMIGVNGAADVKYTGYYTSSDALDGNYYGYFTK